MSCAVCDQPVSGSIATTKSPSHSEFILTDLVRENDRRLLDRLLPLVRSQSLALDLSAVRRIDADGITVLISLYRSALQAGHWFTVSSASPRVEKTLALVGLDRILLSHNVAIRSQSKP